MADTHNTSVVILHYLLSGLCREGCSGASAEICGQGNDTYSEADSAVGE